MAYKQLDGIERDCSDFRGNPELPHCCFFSDSCTGLIEQGMYRDNGIGDESDLKIHCLGISDYSKIVKVRKFCAGEPEKVTKEDIELIGSLPERKTEELYSY